MSLVWKIAAGSVKVLVWTCIAIIAAVLGEGGSSSDVEGGSIHTVGGGGKKDGSWSSGRHKQR